MRKYLLLILCISCFSFSIFAQSDNKNWEVSLTYAYQFDLNKFGESVFGNKQDLHQYGLSFKRFLINKKKVQLLGGLGYSRQQILGLVGVNHCYPGGDICPLYYAMTKNYAIQLAEVPIEIRFPINDKFGIDLSITPQFRFHQNSDYDFKSKFLFDINSIEIYPAISYQLNDFRFSLGGRLLNWQMFDRLFYYHDYPNNNEFYEQTLYRYNPLKLRFTASYMF
ncbi:MAG: hypothetical protein AB8G11_14225 [Saprospiraceae bacterium]